MKITAYFDSPDSADHAAGALKRALSPLAEIQTKNTKHGKTSAGVNSFAVFNTLAGTSPTYSMPIYNAAYLKEADGRESDYIGTDCTVEVICRKEEEAAASRIIIGYGGRNISKL